MEKRKRVPVFILSWTTTYPWLQNGISVMTCTVCTKFDKTGTFITGYKNSCKSLTMNLSRATMNILMNLMMITQYKDIDYRRNDQSKAFSDLSELLETESQNLKCFVKTNKILKLNHC